MYTNKTELIWQIYKFKATLQVLSISRRSEFCKKRVLENFAKFTGKQPQACVSIKKETLAQVFSCELQNTSGGCFLNAL